MNSRGVLLTAVVLGALATAGCQAGSAASRTSDSALPAASVCTHVQTLAYSSAQQNAARQYWTPARIKAAQGFDGSGSDGSGLGASSASSTSSAPSQPSKAAAPSSSVQCVPDSAVTRVPAGRAAHVVGAAAGSRAAASTATSSAGGYPTIGDLTFKADGVADLNCTATVINGTSAANTEELAVTAAHCIEGTVDGIPYTSTDLAFTPDWNDSTGPYGTWTAEKVFLNSGWMHCSIPVLDCGTNPLDDYAVIVLNPQNGEGVGKITGAAGWVINAPATVDGVTLAGIPAGSSDTLTTVADTGEVTESGEPYRTAPTPGFTDGTSGGPWFEDFDASTGGGTLIGDIGGYEQGGPSGGTPSYSDVWNSAFATVVADAVAYED